MTDQNNSDSIPFHLPDLGDAEAEAVAAVVRSGWLVMGAQVEAFERAIAAFTGRRHALAVTSGTAALHLAMHALGVGPHHEVFVPAWTWPATAAVPHHLGARVTLVDTAPGAFTLDPDALDRALAASRAAHRLVVPVHLFGYRADVADVAAAHGADLLGDACCAFGGTDQGLRCGAWAPIEVLSFHPRKVITTGEGGMVLLDDDALASRLRALRDHGALRSDDQRAQAGRGGPLLPHFPEPGFNLRMTDLQAALGNAQLQRLPDLLDARQRLAARYDALLANQHLLLPPPDHPGRLLTLYPVRLGGALSPGMRETLLYGLARHNISARPPMPLLADLPWLQPQHLPLDNARATFATTLAFPFFPSLTEAQCARVVQTALSTLYACII